MNHTPAPPIAENAPPSGRKYAAKRRAKIDSINTFYFVMSAIVINVRKSASWDTDNERAFVVVDYSPVHSHSGKLSKIHSGAVGDSQLYVKTYDLARIFTDKDGDDSELYSEETGKLLKKKALQEFCKLLPIGTLDEEMILYDIPISEISPYSGVKIAENGRAMYTLHPASLSPDREVVKAASKRNLENRLREKVWLPITEKSEDEKEEEDD